MKVSVAVHGRFHAFELAAALHRVDALAGLLTTYPAFAARRFLPPGVPLLTAPHLELVRRLNARLPWLGVGGDLAVAGAFGRFAAHRLPPCDLVTAWSGAGLEVLAEAKRRGIPALLERGSTHIAAQTETLRTAFARWGVEWNGTDPRLIARETAEYDAAAGIVVGSLHSRDSFVARGFDPARLHVNNYGVDLDIFAPVAGEIRRAGPRRLLFVGRVGVRKGVPWLLEAFARLPADWELHLVGPVEVEMPAIAARLPLDRVVWRGPLPRTALAEEYRACDLFVLPSVEEGLAMVILQAMACGAAVVASTESGGRDAGRDGEEIALVPPADSVALAETLNRLAADPEERRRMGAAARRRVVTGFSWEDYGRRALDLYVRVLMH